MDELLEQSIRQQKAGAKQAMGKWLEEQGEFDVFATVTLRPTSHGGGRGTHTKPGWGQAHKAARVMLRLLDAKAWALVFEMQDERGVPHIHALVQTHDPKRLGVDTGSANARRAVFDNGTAIDIQEVLYELVGVSRLRPYRKSEGAAFYLGKYLSKEQSYVTIASDRARGAKIERW